MTDNTWTDALDRQLAAGRFDAALQDILTQFGADSGTLHFLGEDGQLHLRAHSAGLPEAVLAVIRAIPVGKGMAGLAVERNAPVDACNLQTDTSGDVRPGAKATGLQGSIVVPVRDGSAVVGALGIANRSPRSFTDEEVAALLEIATRCGAHRG